MSQTDITADVISNLPLDRIDAVAFYKLDALTTDLICCDIEMAGQVWTFHEEAAGWDSLIAHLSLLPGFKANWRKVVVHPPFEVNTTEAFRRA
ncbi:hypothetical protein [Sphingomonas turrisvirgatae]|uniref:Uncharacterized protein n=1 Tax=Sphingomonas turrisvirgatae TaxID=1888892 RepID=A0A1E3LQG0_9SPHN|nr:hypothetical protein [Sphingomonas turrisvirgatae]ODP35987.1 hypothetical protein BFL28_07830 [Sphingomonas turrisvirgatae]